MMKYKRIAIVFQTLLCGIFLVDHYAFPALAVQKLEAAGPTGMQRQDYEIKAGLIAKIIDYCKWPPASPAENPHIPFTIGAFEKNELVSYLMKRVETRKIKGRRWQRTYKENWISQDTLS